MVISPSVGMYVHVCGCLGRGYKVLHRFGALSESVLSSLDVCASVRTVWGVFTFVNEVN